MKPQAGVWVKRLKILFCSAGEQEVAEEEGKVFFLHTVYIVYDYLKAFIVLSSSAASTVTSYS